MPLRLRGPRGLQTDRGGVSASQESLFWRCSIVLWVLEYALRVVVTSVHCCRSAFVGEELLGDGFLLQLRRLRSVLALRCRSSGSGDSVDCHDGELSVVFVCYCNCL